MSMSWTRNTLSISRRSMERTLDLTSLALMDVLSLSSSTSWLPVWSLPSSFSQCTRGALCKNPLGVIFPCSRAERATECCSQFTTHTGHRYVRQNTV
ncbi:unnamed protein product [Durusdinium trenchii]|uniref:Secreted protein n=1 Tax=Durusdinium trenchii TaxID=1381693 RepID=A0ABP0QXV9_9DINO